MKVQCKCSPTLPVIAKYVPFSEYLSADLFVFEFQLSKTFETSWVYPFYEVSILDKKPLFVLPLPL